MSTEKWVLLGRLRRAVKKVKFLLNLNLNRWRIASIIGAGSLSRRTISFNDRPGLRAWTDDLLINSISSNVGQDDDSGSSSRVQQIQRTPSLPSDQDDIDKRAGIFIANFRNQLRMERQVSLELRYNRRDTSFDSNSP